MDTKMIAALATGLALGACQPTTTARQETVYKTLTVRPESRTLTTEYAATLAGQQVVEVRPQVGGLIQRICISEGQPVRKGQVLFVIDQVPYRAAWEEDCANVKSAEAQLATARLNLSGTRALHEKGVVKDHTLQTAVNDQAAAEAALAQAKAQEVNARNNLSYTEVKSPINGVAGMINYREGALVSSSISTPLVTVSDDSVMYAYFSLTETQVTDLLEQYGSPDELMRQMPAAGLRMSNGKTYAEQGHIRAISGIVDSGTGAVTLRADFPNPHRRLLDGGSATVVLPYAKDSCIVIPQGATYELQDKVFVYRLSGGRPQQTPVSVFRLNNGTEYIVESGLQEGDTIIAEGAGLIN